MKNVEEVLRWADQVLLDTSGEKLTSIEEAILTGVLEGKKYSEIAKYFNWSESQVKKEASKLWEKLSEELGEDLNKSNFRYKLEKKYKISEVFQCKNCLFQEIDINIDGQFIQTIKDPKMRSPSPPETHPTQNCSPIISLIDAPTLTEFHNRTSELTTLKHWILEEKNRLITIYGLSGIGKSAIALKLIEEINTEFDYIIWKSLNNRLSLSTLQTELKDFVSESQQTPLPTIIDYFRNFRCLVILDDIQDIFKSGELAGQYLPGYENYGKFFKQVATSSHQSCLILLSWIQPREIVTLEAEHQLIKILNLQGVGQAATEILRKKGLTDEERWLELITLYQGHPSWLNIIASTICEYFNGSVSLFLAEEEEIYLGDLEPLLESQLECLSKSEKRVALWLASQDELVNLSQRPVNLELSKSEFWQTIQSLGRRGLIEKVEGETRSLFTLNRIFKYYLKQKLS